MPAPPPPPAALMGQCAVPNGTVLKYQQQYEQQNI
jgi:hypothetical protein